MKKQPMRIAILVILIAGLGYTMYMMDNSQRSRKPQIPNNVAAQRAKDLARLVDRKAKNWIVDPKLELVKTRTGLKYQDIKIGKGAMPKYGESVIVDYVGWDTMGVGRVFDTSLKSGREPITFHVGKKEMIKGFDEGVASMRVGGVRRLIIPPDLGYGELGAVPAVPPNATLAFMVRLVGISSKK